MILLSTLLGLYSLLVTCVCVVLWKKLRPTRARRISSDEKKVLGWVVARSGMDCRELNRATEIYPDDRVSAAIAKLVARGLVLVKKDGSYTRLYPTDNAELFMLDEGQS